MSFNTKLPEKLKKRINSGKITEQKLWKFIRELNSFSNEKLETVALISDGERITYKEMFDEWDRYARVFSALGINEENNSRAGLLSGRDKGSVYSLYGLNITGTSVSLLHELDILDHKRWDQMILKEGITDLVLIDKKLTRSRLVFICGKKEELGIRNIIILKASVGENENYRSLKKVDGVLFMEDLFDKYTENDIIYSTEKSKDDAVIFHTSGTTSGIHKPVPISDRGFNESAARLLRDDRFNGFSGVVSILSVEMTSAYGSCNMLHLPLAYGGTVILMSQGATKKHLINAIKRYSVNIFFAVRDIFELLEDLKERPDLSSLELVFIGGSYVSPNAKRRYCKFLKDCNSNAKVFVGYGMTETCGAVVLAEDDCFEDSIGKPLSGVKIKILDEMDGEYYDISDGERTGVMCISSPSVSSGVLNGTNFFELVDIDGEKYLNTYDMVEVNSDESLRIVGRMNKFFVNNEGIRFDAGLIETAISAEPDVISCGLVPEYNKQLHDTVPILYIQLADRNVPKRRLIENIFYRVFIEENKIKDTNLPASVVICSNLPVNQMGKVDVWLIARRNLKGERYVVKPVRRRDKLIAVRIIPWKEAGIYMNGGVPEELEYDMKLYKQLLEGRHSDMRRRGNCMCEPGFVAKVLKSFFEVIDKAYEECESERRRHSRHRFEDMNSMYCGFGDRYEEEYDDDVEDDDDEESFSGRACMGREGSYSRNPEEMMSKIGRYFSASDYDKDYDEDYDEEYDE